MNRNSESFVRRAHRGRHGQALIIVAFSLVMLLGFTGFVIDVGHLYYAQRELQASSDAAAMAGAQALPNTTWQAQAIAYSSVTGGANAYANLPNVTMTAGNPAAECSSTVTGWGIACAPPSNYNVVRVEQQATVPLNFMGLIGPSSYTIKAASYAAMKGAARAPYNVAFVIDATPSMRTSENEANCTSTRIACALQGIRVMLSNLSPCGANLSSCGTATANAPGGALVPNSVDTLAMYVFPPVTSTTASNDYTCSGAVSVAPYMFTNPPVSPPLYLLPPSTGYQYQIVNFSSDYKSSDQSTTLNTTSNLVAAAGGKPGCAGAQAGGGIDTYYAQVIYTAQADLVRRWNQNKLTQNVMIILSDADATARCTSSSGGICTAGDMPGASTTGTTYPSLKQQCHQGLTAALAAQHATPPTTVYTVAYGTPSTGCSSDTNPPITPCQVMSQMATNNTTFFADYGSSTNPGACQNAARPTSSLTQIFTEIAGDLTTSRMTPGSVW